MKGGREAQSKATATLSLTQSKKTTFEKKYIELRSHWIFIFEKEAEPQPGTLPQRLVFTDGLYIESISPENRKPFGLEISHRHSCYGILQIIFDQKEVYDKWKGLILLQSKLIQDFYEISDEILGRGRFSFVYKGWPKEKNKKRGPEVAIKIINKDALKEKEEDIIE